MVRGYPSQEEGVVGHDEPFWATRQRAVVASPRRRHARVLVALIALAGIVLVGLALLFAATPTPPQGLALVDGQLQVPAAVEAVDASPSPVGVVELPAGVGPRLVIPAVGIDAPLDGQLVISPRGWVPPDWSIGWGADSAPVWAEEGSSLLAGHVWVGDKPGVLAELHQIIPGMLVALVDDERRQDFLVTSVSEFPRDELPSWVWGSIDGDRRVVIVTCAGSPVNHDGRRVWSKNLVVVAVPTVGTANK